MAMVYFLIATRVCPAGASFQSMCAFARNRANAEFYAKPSVSATELLVECTVDPPLAASHLYAALETTVSDSDR